MRTAHWKAHLLPLLLLSLHSVSLCLADVCLFDDFMENFGRLNIVRAKEQQTGQDWEPLRIVASTKDFQGPSKYCAKKNGPVHERTPQDTDADCKGYFGTLTPKESRIAVSILEKAIALHTDRLLVRRAVGPLEIPDFSKHEFCKFFNVPAEHRTNGVANADMVLYVAYTHRLGGDASAVSLGLTCAKSAGGRPIAGALMFGNDNIEISRLAVRITAHQIAHALGFSYSEMNSRNMIMNKTVRSKINPVAVVKSDKTKKMTLAHYGCLTADGMELEDGRDNKEKLSHWERRNAKDELMAKPIGDLGTSFMGFYTNLTMAFFEDLGFYKAKFQMAEHMEYGHNAGCEFLTGKCMEKGVTKWPNMFCNVSLFDRGQHVCTTDRLGLGACLLRNDYSSPLPEYFQYFASPNEGGVSGSLTDYCAVVEQPPSFGCTNSAQQGKMPGSLFGKNSMCLDGSALKVKGTPDVTVSAVCAEILCEGGSVKVRYLGDKDGNTWHNCPEGQSLTPSSTSSSFVSGTIKCPKYKEVCTVGPDGSSLVPKVTGPNGPKDSSSVPFGLIPPVAFLVLSFAGYMVA